LSGSGSPACTPGPTRSAAVVAGLAGALLGMCFSFTPTSGHRVPADRVRHRRLGAWQREGHLLGGLGLGLVENWGALVLGDGYRVVRRAGAVPGVPGRPAAGTVRPGRPVSTETARGAAAAGGRARPPAAGPAGAGRVARWRPARPPVTVAVALALALPYLVRAPTTSRSATGSCSWRPLASAWNLLAGLRRPGLARLGRVRRAGPYTAAELANRAGAPVPLLLPAGALVAAGFAVLVSPAMFRECAGSTSRSARWRCPRRCGS